MAYSKLDILTKVSAAADYSRPSTEKSYELTGTPTLVYNMIVPAITTTTAVEIADFTTIDLLIAHNTHATETVSVQWSDADGNANTCVVPPGRVLVIPSVDPADTFSLDTSAATANVDVTIYGA